MKFKVGDRVKTGDNLRRQLSPRAASAGVGTVVYLHRNGDPKIQWDGNKTATKYSSELIELESET